MSGPGEEGAVTEGWESASLKLYREPGRQGPAGGIGRYQSSQEPRILRFHTSE
jgi:hypothetical protein